MHQVACIDRKNYRVLLSISSCFLLDLPQVCVLVCLQTKRKTCTGFLTYLKFKKYLLVFSLDKRPINSRVHALICETGKLGLPKTRPVFGGCTRTTLLGWKICKKKSLHTLFLYIYIRTSYFCAEVKNFIWISWVYSLKRFYYVLNKFKLVWYTLLLFVSMSMKSS